MDRLDQQTRMDRAMTLAQPHRMKVSPEHRSSERAESPFGRLNLEGKISEAEYQAGSYFLVDAGNYRAAIQGPREGPTNGRGYACMPDACAIFPQDCECLHRVKRFTNAWGAMSKGVRSEVSMVVVGRMEPVREFLPRLRAGLQALVKHYRLDGPPEGRMRKWQA